MRTAMAIPLENYCSELAQGCFIRRHTRILTPYSRFLDVIPWNCMSGSECKAGRECSTNVMFSSFL